MTAQPFVRLLLGDNMCYYPEIPDSSIAGIYIDPPFNTGKTQRRTQLSTTRAADGDRTGFGGHRYTTSVKGTKSYDDSYEDYLSFLEPRLRESYRVLSPTGSMFVHLDYREVHYVKVLLDSIFGRASFINEIIWAYDYGARTKKKWPTKHDSILWYAKNPKNYFFSIEECDRIPYMAPGLVGAAKAAAGKTPTDTWWHTIVPTNGSEKTGYPTQKPLGVMNRIVRVHSAPGDTWLDSFAGSGSLGVAAVAWGCNFIGMDRNPEAILCMQSRFAATSAEVTLVEPSHAGLKCSS